MLLHLPSPWLTDFLMMDIEAALFISILESMAERKEERSSTEPLDGRQGCVGAQVTGKGRGSRTLSCDWFSLIDLGRGSDMGELLKLLVLFGQSWEELALLELDELLESI